MKNKFTWTFLKEKFASGSVSDSGDDCEGAAATAAVVGGGDGGCGVSSAVNNSNLKAKQIGRCF